MIASHTLVGNSKVTLFHVTVGSCHLQALCVCVYTNLLMSSPTLFKTSKLKFQVPEYWNVPVQNHIKRDSQEEKVYRIQSEARSMKGILAFFIHRVVVVVLLNKGVVYTYFPSVIF